MVSPALELIFIVFFGILRSAEVPGSAGQDFKEQMHRYVEPVQTFDGTAYQLRVLDQLSGKPDLIDTVTESQVRLLREGYHS
jgi:hypothetical protein